MTLTAERIAEDIRAQQRRRPDQPVAEIVALGWIQSAARTESDLTADERLAEIRAALDALDLIRAEELNALRGNA